MKQLLFAFTAGTLFLASCQSAPEADKAEAGDAQQATNTTGTNLSIDTTTTYISWIGTKVGGQHNGTFKVTEGNLTVNEGNLVGGTFVIDMKSVAVLDLQGEDRGKLEGHLKSPDFFAADSFPTARFEITGVEAFDSTKVTSKLNGASHIISGNLTMRNTTKNISFPAVVSLSEGSVSAKADFNIDRSQWGVNFKGPNNPADWVIAKEVNLKLDVTAKNTGL